MINWSDINILLHSIYLDQLSSSFFSCSKGFLLKFPCEFYIYHGTKGYIFSTYISLFLIKILLRFIFLKMINVYLHFFRDKLEGHINPFKIYFCFNFSKAAKMNINYRKKCKYQHIYFKLEIKMGAFLQQLLFFFQLFFYYFHLFLDNSENN